MRVSVEPLSSTVTHRWRPSWLGYDNVSAVLPEVSLLYSHRIKPQIKRLCLARPGPGLLELCLDRRAARCICQEQIKYELADLSGSQANTMLLFKTILYYMNTALLHSTLQYCTFKAYYYPLLPYYVILYYTIIYYTMLLNSTVQFSSRLFSYNSLRSFPLSSPFLPSPFPSPLLFCSPLL